MGSRNNTFPARLSFKHTHTHTYIYIYIYIYIYTHTHTHTHTYTHTHTHTHTHESREKGRKRKGKTGKAGRFLSLEANIFNFDLRPAVRGGGAASRWIELSVCACRTEQRWCTGALPSSAPPCQAVRHLTCALILSSGIFSRGECRTT
jgi:hypothetical protein